MHMISVMTATLQIHRVVCMFVWHPLCLRTRLWARWCSGHGRCGHLWCASTSKPPEKHTWGQIDTQLLLINWNDQNSDTKAQQHGMYGTAEMEYHNGSRGVILVSVKHLNNDSLWAVQRSKKKCKTQCLCRNKGSEEQKEKKLAYTWKIFQATWSYHYTEWPQFL